MKQKYNLKNHLTPLFWKRPGFGEYPGLIGQNRSKELDFLVRPYFSSVIWNEAA